MEETYVELAGEDHRWWDLVRWHKGGDVNLSGWTGRVNGFNTNLASSLRFDANKHLVFPLPQVDRQCENLRF